MFCSFKVSNILKTISKELLTYNAKAIVVGGSVRDCYLNMPIKDYDIEVYGLNNMSELEKILAKYGHVNLVGKSFGILKLKVDRDEYDFSFPRRESKIGLTHRDFSVIVDGNMNYREAALRRDFTMNAMGYDIENNSFLDPFDAIKDLKKKELKHINSKTFREDPLRVYRAIQFCARFKITLSDETFVLCKDMVDRGTLNYLAKERIFEEFKKLLLKSSKPSLGFELMRELGVLKQFPELQAIMNEVTWTYTMKSLDSMANLLNHDKKKNILYMLTILSNHLLSLEVRKSFLYRLTDEHKLIDKVLSLVDYYLKISQFKSATDRDIRYLSTKINIEELISIAKAEGVDCSYLEKRSKDLNVYNKALKNLLQGKDLIKLGFTPSPIFKKILNKIYLLQIDGIVTNYEDAIAYIKEFMIKK